MYFDKQNASFDRGTMWLLSWRDTALSHTSIPSAHRHVRCGWSSGPGDVGDALPSPTSPSAGCSTSASPGGDRRSPSPAPAARTNASDGGETVTAGTRYGRRSECVTGGKWRRSSAPGPRDDGSCRVRPGVISGEERRGGFAREGKDGGACRRAGWGGGPVRSRG